MRFAIPFAAAALSFSGGVLPAQTFDASGNSMLNGAYYMRDVAYSGVSEVGVIGLAQTLYGTITFDGQGHYQFSGQFANSMSSVVSPYQVSGTYSVMPSGLANLQNPLPQNASITMYGAAGASGVVASSTESGLHDFLIAIPAGSGNATNKDVTGSFTGGLMDVPQANVNLALSAYFNLVPDGAGGFAGITVSGSGAGLPNGGTTQNISGATYSVSGAGLIAASFPQSSSPSAATQALLQGDKLLYISAARDIMIGGSANGFDMIVALRTASTATDSLFQGTYFVAGATIDNSDPSVGTAVDSQYGSVVANGNGANIWHFRINPAVYGTYDYTTDGAYQLSSDGTLTDVNSHTAVGAGGKSFLVTGSSSSVYQLIFGVGAPTVSGTGVFLNPLGIVNAAGFEPVTNPVSPGELITLYGIGLASSPASASGTSPASLGGVQVTVNGYSAPMFAVAPGYASVLVPYEIAGAAYANIQLTNDGAASNMVTAYVRATAPGIFTIPSGGTGSGAILHADYSLVSTNSPAQPGETVAIFLTGLGAVSPSVPNGSLGPSNPLSQVTAPLRVFIGGIESTIVFSGLAPGVPGLYQLNCVVPQNAPDGDDYVDIETPNAYYSQATVNVRR
jgi:uncharacterized protein (TIGR03437 family)